MCIAWTLSFGCAMCILCVSSMLIKLKSIDACSGDLQPAFAESSHFKHNKHTLNTQERSIPLKVIS